MALSTTAKRALFALKQNSYSLENATMLLSRSFASSHDGLGNSLSDGFYEAASSRATDSKAWPKSSDARVVKAKQQNSLAEHEVLGNSLSEGNYAAGGSRAHRRIAATALSSMSDPDTFWVGSSMSDGYYQMPASLRGANSRNIKRSQSHRSAGPQSLPLMQRVASKNIGLSDSGRLHNSYSATGY